MLQSESSDENNLESKDSSDERKHKNESIGCRLRKKRSFFKISLTEEELEFRKQFKTVNVLTEFPELICCTKCGINFEDDVLQGKKIHSHPLLKVLMCETCCQFFGDGEFSLDEDGEDKYCRWCGEGGNIFLCSNCICGFCPQCIKKNFGKKTTREIKNDDDWKCYLCNPEPLWKLRNICQLTTELSAANKLKNSKNSSRISRKTSKWRVSKKVKEIASSDKDDSKYSKNENGVISKRRLTYSRRTYSERASGKGNTSSSSLPSSCYNDEPAVKKRKITRYGTRGQTNRTNGSGMKEWISDKERMCSCNVYSSLDSSDETDESDGDDERHSLKENLKFGANKNAEKLREILKVTKITSELCSELCRKETRKLEKKNFSVSNEKLASDCEKLKSMIILMSSSLSTVHNMILSLQQKFGSKGLDNVFSEGAGFTSLLQGIARIIMDKKMKTSHLVTLVNDILNIYPYVALGSKGIDYSADVNDYRSVNLNDYENQNSSVILDAKFGDVQIKENSESNTIINSIGQSAKFDSFYPGVMSADGVAPDGKGKPICDSDTSTDIFEPDSFDVTYKNLTSNSAIQKSDTDMNSEKLKKKSLKFDIDMNNVYENSLRLKKQLLEDSSEESHSSEMSVSSINYSNIKKKSVKKKDKKERLKNIEKKNLTQEEKEIARLTNMSSLKSRRKMQDSDSDSDSDSKSKRIVTNDRKNENDKKNNKRDENGSCIDNILLNAESDDHSWEIRKHPIWEDETSFLNNCSKFLKEYILEYTSSEPENVEQESKNKIISKRKERHVSSDNESNLLLRIGRRRCLSESISNCSTSSSSSSSSDISSEEVSTDSFQPYKPKKRKWKELISESDSSDVISVKSFKKGNQSKSRKSIRKILKKESLQLGTRQAIKIENERKKRMAHRKECYEKFFPNMYNSDRLVLDFNLETGEVLLEVPKSISKLLKPHQKEGVKFMWDNCFESLEKLEEDSGSGCILAHCMGLGKTFQVITLVATLMKNDLGVNTVLILCPLNVVNNWIEEFEHWLEDDDLDVVTYSLVKNNLSKRNRYFTIFNWHTNGGVLILSYDMMRNLTNERYRSKWKAEAADNLIKFLLDPGPDLVICDEGHVLKNNVSSISQSMQKIKTARRIVLTGTPFQNNLLEYHSMVQFIKPNILGTKKEFMNRFGNPIKNGQFEDSTALDVKLMRARSHVLHKLLDGVIQRFDYSVLTPFLPEKHEYVISIRLTKLQSQLYKYYVDKCKKNVIEEKGGRLFNDFNWLQKIWTHPKVVVTYMQERSLKKNDVEVSSDESVICIAPDASSDNYWKQVIKQSHCEDIHSSGKLLVLFDILSHCRKIGDKVLVFSNSLKNLNLIEEFLQKIHKANNSKGKSEGCEKIPSAYLDTWVEGTDYFRMDGSTTSLARSNFCKWFNSEKKPRARLFLISTKAGGLGINLVGANRVVVFDASWNPSHDVQSIFRVYRFGQTKTCYIYRLVAEATMEEKIYERQVTKLSLERRVLDEHQIERHYSMGNLQSLYKYDPLPRDQWKIPMVPKDLLLIDILKVRKDIIVAYHEHDSLLENKEDEGMTEEERKMAWEDFEKERFMNENTEKGDISFLGKEKTAEQLAKEIIELTERIPHSIRNLSPVVPIPMPAPFKIVNVRSLNKLPYEQSFSYQKNFPQTSTRTGL